MGMLQEFAHHAGSRLAPLPEIPAVVEVAGDGSALAPRDGNRVQREIRSGAADGGGDAANVEPSRIFEYRVPIETFAAGVRDGALFAIVDNSRRALIRA